MDERKASERGYSTIKSFVDDEIRDLGEWLVASELSSSRSLHLMRVVRRTRSTHVHNHTIPVIGLD